MSSHGKCSHVALEAVVVLLINYGSEWHPTDDKTFGVNLPEAQCKQIKDDSLSAAGRLDCYDVMPIEQAIDGKNLE